MKIDCLEREYDFFKWNKSYNVYVCANTLNTTREINNRKTEMCVCVCDISKRSEIKSFIRKLINE